MGSARFARCGDYLDMRTSTRTVQRRCSSFASSCIDCRPLPQQEPAHLHVPVSSSVVQRCVIREIPLIGIALSHIQELFNSSKVSKVTNAYKRAAIGQVGHYVTKRAQDLSTWPPSLWPH